MHITLVFIYCLVICCNSVFRSSSNAAGDPSTLKAQNTNLGLHLYFPDFPTTTPVANIDIESDGSFSGSLSLSLFQTQLVIKRFAVASAKEQRIVYMQKTNQVSNFPGYE